MPPKGQQQHKAQGNRAVDEEQSTRSNSTSLDNDSSTAATTAAAGTSGSTRPQMNYFAALAGTDPDAQLDEIAVDEERRRQATAAASSGSNGTAAAGTANGKEGWNGGGLKQPLVWIDLGE